MKKSVRILLVVLCLATVLSAIGVFSFADGETKQGWTHDVVTDGNGDSVLDENGNPVLKERYYVDGVALTGGPHTIGIYQYMFADDGEYIGMYDAYKNVGTPGVMDTEAFKTAVAARDPVEAHTFDAGTKFGTSKTDIKTVIPVGGIALENFASGSRYFSSNLWTVLRKADYRFVPKNGSNTNLAYYYGHASEDEFYKLNNSSAHTYTDRSGLANLYSTGFVVDFELMLADIPSSGLNIMSLSDRKTASDANETYTGLDEEQVLAITKDGFLYSQKKSSLLLASFMNGEFVRVSVAVDNPNNKFDIYVNGVLMLDDVVLYDNTAQNVKEFKIEEMRMFQLSSSTPNNATYALDNFYIYPGTTPVCTETAVLKNGVHIEGSYIRNYENGAAKVGNLKITGEYFGQSIDENISFSPHTGAGFVGYKAHVTRDGITVSNAVIPSNIFTAPDEVDVAGKEFIAWKVTLEGKSTLYAPGKRIRATDNLTADAVGIGIAMLDGASLKTVDGTSELRFMAKLSKADYDNLTVLGATVEPHILIAKTSAFEKTHGYYNYEHLSAIEGVTPIDIKATDWYDSNDSYYYFTGSVGNIEDILEEYSAVAYLKITLPDGTVKEVFSGYSAEKNSRSVHYVADKAYNDRTLKNGVGKYSEKVAFEGTDTFSPYRSGERSLMKKVLDKVAVVNTGTEGVTIGGAYYKSPYEVDDMDGAVTLGGDYDISSIVAVIVDGVRLKDEDIDREDGTIKLDVDNGLVILSADDSEFDNWNLMNFNTDSSVFNTVIKVPGFDASVNIPAPPIDETSVGKWKAVAKNLNLGKFSYFNSKRYEKNGNVYFDLSQINTFSFWVYVPSGFEGATFLMLFNSDNPSTADGTDYYSYMVTLPNSGWNKISTSKNNCGASRSPLGWDRITSIEFTANGWSQNNKSDLVLYFTGFEGSNSTGSNGILYASNLTANGGAVFANKGYSGVVDGKRIIFNPKDTTTVSYKEGDVWYLPLNAFAAAKDDETYYYSKAGIIQFIWDDEEYTFKSGESCYYKDGKKAGSLTSPIVHKNGAIYVTHHDAMKLFGYTQVQEDQMGLLVLSNTENILANAENDNIFNAINDMVFVRPDGNKVIEDMEAYSQFKHPYLMADAERWEELEYYYKHDETLRYYLSKIDASYGVESSNFKKAVNSFSRTDGIRLLSISRDVMNKTISWALLYKLEYKLGDHTAEERKQILDRIWAEVEAVCEFYDEEKRENSWNPSHFLDTAELSYPMGLMYDWFYDEWTPEQRSKLAKAIYENALCQTSSLPGTYNYNLAGSTNNWNGVCNGGIMAGALAIVNDEWIIKNGYRNNVIKVIGDSVKAVERGMWVYAPDGGYEEGPGYWGYGSTYVQVWIGCVQSACGTNYGIYDAPGYEKSCLFTTYLGNGKTTWGFHDGGSGNATPEITGFFSYMSGNGAYNAIKRTAHALGWTSGVSKYDVIWFDPHVVDKSLDLTLDSYYSLDPIMTFRSSWDTNNNIFAGLHGGDNQASHGDLDIGNFVIDVNGTYMICDLGSDSYNMNGYFGAYRWSYYRKRTEGQNTLVMLKHGETWNGKTGVPQEYILDKDGNIRYGSDGKPLWSAGNKPDSNYYGQKATAVSKAIDFKSGATKAYGIIDMTPAYTAVKDGTVMKRGLYMTNNRSTVVIQDEGEFKTNQDIWWFAHTQGVITVLPGGKSAYVERNGIYLYAEIVEDPNAPLNATFTTMEAESLDQNYVGDKVESGIYTGETEGSRSSLTKLCVSVKNAGKFNIAVAFTVVNSPNVLPEMGTLYAWTPMDQWVVD